MYKLDIEVIPSLHTCHNEIILESPLFYSKKLQLEFSARVQSHCYIELYYLYNHKVDELLKSMKKVFNHLQSLPL